MKKKGLQIRIAVLLLLSLLFAIQNLQARNYNRAIPFEENKPIAICDDGILITKSELLNMGQVTFNPDDSEFSMAFRVISFTVSTRVGEYEVSYEQTNGPRFTNQQVALIRKAKSHSKIYIENIKAVGPEGKIRNLGSIVFKIR